MEIERHLLAFMSNAGEKSRPRLTIITPCLKIENVSPSYLPILTHNLTGCKVNASTACLLG